MAEFHCFGSIIGSDENFDQTGLFARWKISHGSNWELIEGQSSGETQIDFPNIGARSHWSHPIDVHFVCNGIQGWPRIEFQVFKEDSYGRVCSISYGFIHLPSSPGYHELKCYTWKPVGSIYNRLYSFFTGSSLILRNPEMIYNPNERYRIRTETSGTLSLQLYVITKNFDRYGVELN
ncbi:B9 domain-containing protein 2-like [Brevipalpus obovatus]|uniref:B9 domain-containing protein 2-like n=1 Tax=Brevipalpus obovatus TaxID=246614 RepID=UPI003D9E24B1